MVHHAAGREALQIQQLSNALSCPRTTPIFSAPLMSDSLLTSSVMSGNRATGATYRK